MVARTAVFRLVRALGPAAALVLSLVAAEPAFATFATRCDTGCHNTAGISGARRNAADSVAVINAANTAHGMGVGAFSAEFPGIATEIGAAFTPSQTRSVGYRTTGNSITINNMVIDSSPPAVITTTATVTGPGSGTLTTGFASSLAVSYDHTGTTCGVGIDSFVVKGTGLADTSNRTVDITVTAPTVSSSDITVAALAYNTVAVSRNISSAIVVSGTGSAATGTLALSGQSGSGTISATGPTTFTYAATGTTYSASVTVNYIASGPCSSTSGPSTNQITIPVSLPPAPTAANLGPITVAAGNGVTTPVPVTGLAGFRAASPLVVVSQPPPGEGTVTVTGAAQFTYTGSGFAGATSFTYQVLGPTGSGLTSITRTITLSPTAAPIGSDQDVGNTPFNTPIMVDVAPFITGSFTSVTPGAAVNGTVGFAGSVVTFTPTAGFFGIGTFQYTATGPGGTSAGNTITIHVLPPPPIAGPGTATAAFQTATVIDVTPFITGVQTPPVTAFNPVSGAINLVSGNQVTFTPAPGFIGMATFQYQASGPGGLSGIATVTVTVNAPAAPVVVPFSTLVSATAPTVIDVSPFVTGFFNTIVIVSQPNAGTATVNGTMITFTPVVGFIGTTTLTYRADGPGGMSNVALGTLQFTTAPVTPDRTLSVPFNTVTEFDLGAMISGVYSAINFATQPAHGIILVRGGIMTYTPETGYFGPDTFTYTATGTGGTSTPGTVRVTVNPPVAQVTGGTVNVSFNNSTQIDLSKYITGTATSYTITTQPGHGTLVLSGSIATYTPTPGYFGPDSFKFRANNGAGTSAEATITLNVTGLKPVATSASMVVELNTPKSLDLAPFIQGSGVQGVSIPKLSSTRGTVEVNGLVITYTPRHNFFGSDSFQYIAYGNLGSSAPATVNVTVVGRPDPRDDPDVRGLVDAQAQVPDRFARAQVSNFQRRMETAHRGPDSAFPDKPTPPAPTPAPAPSARGNGNAPSDALARIPEGTRDRDASTGSSPIGGQLVSSLISLATSQTVAVNGATTFGDTTSVWITGLAQFGELNAEGGRSGSRFSTNGMSLGIDRRFSDRLVLGLGGGYARDRAGIGSNGTNSNASGGSFSLYGSFQPTGRTYLDALVGFGKIDMDSQRFVPEIEQFASATRKIDQVFGSVAFGYEWRQDGMLVSPYGRLDFTSNKFKTATETGGDQYNLTYNGQTQRGSTGAIGLRAESQHETDFGRAIPRFRVEYRRDFQDDRTTVLSYADLFGGPEYSVTSKGTSRNALLLGVGTEFLVNGGLKVGFDYSAEHSSGSKNVQSWRIFASQDLDFKALPPMRFTSTTMAKPISVDFGASYDDNVSRGRLTDEKRSDSMFSLGIGQEWIVPWGTNFRLVATPLVTGEKFRRWAGLGRISGGMQAEVQYRGSGAFDATTFGVKGLAVYDQYESSLRTGGRYFVGLNARRSFTDKIDAFAEIGTNQRNGKSEVFHLRDYSAKANLDYSLGRTGLVYLTGEFRKGDTFASGLPSLANAAIADVFTVDDAFENQLVAYRLEARTALGVIGFNRPLGPRDSIDFSYRRVQTDPSNKPSFDAGGPLKYIDNQYSIVYLLRF